MMRFSEDNNVVSKIHNTLTMLKLCARDVPWQTCSVSQIMPEEGIHQSVIWMLQWDSFQSASEERILPPSEIRRGKLSFQILG